VNSSAVAIETLNRMAQIDSAIVPTIFENLPIKYSLAEIAEIAGTTVEHVFTMTRWIGSVPRAADDVHYTDLDLQAVQSAVDFERAAGMEDKAMGTLLRGMAFSMERLTTRLVEAIIQQNETTRHVSDTEARLLAAEEVPSLAGAILPMLEHVYRRQLAISTRRLTTEAVLQRGLQNDDTDYPLVRAMGFADLVDFTARTEKASASEFKELVQHFRDTTWDIVNSGRGRTINYIGDAVFFVADTAAQGAEIALQLAAPGALGICGQVRVGMVWSRVIATYGDAYGPGVNLAARLCSHATPGEVFIGQRATRILRKNPRYEVVPQPKFEAHGIGTVHPSRLRYASEPGKELSEPN